MAAWRAFLMAVQFLTLLPIHLREAPKAREVGLSVLFYPLVGFGIGAVLYGLDYLLRLTAVPSLVSAALLLAIWVLASGALHLDGLADSADAWVGGRGACERTLSLMKDPHCGAMAVICLVVVLLVKFAVLHALMQQEKYGLLCVSPLLARAALPLLFLTTPYVRPGGLGSLLVENLPRKRAIAVIILSALAVVAWQGLLGVQALLCALLLFVFLRHKMRQRIKGTTGDTAGALVELLELVILLGCLPVLS